MYSNNITMDNRYIHDELNHNLISPREIVPILIELLNPRSVVDFGCGIGTFLHVFQENNVQDVLGLDGAWVNKDLLTKYVDPVYFKEVNFEDIICLDRKFDLAISLEVAEHLDEKYADVFIDTITRHSDVVVFSAAIPNQGGQNHLNEQWPSYWQEKFAVRGFKMFDVLRPLFWNNSDVFFWYKQNMFLYVKNEVLEVVLPKIESARDRLLPDVVHPIVYEQILNRVILTEDYKYKYDSVVGGSSSYISYARMIWYHTLRKMGLKKS